MRFIPMLLIGALVVFAAIAYPIALSNSRTTVTIKVDDKERGSGTGEHKTPTLVFGTKETFKVSDSLLAGTFSSADTYRRLKRGHTYKCEVQGWRIPLFSSFRNITSCDFGS